MRRLSTVLAAALAATGIAVVGAAPASAATASFKSFAQCLNATVDGKSCTSWSNGTINATNSKYAEDQSIPQRVVVTIPADNLEHTLVFQYQDRKGDVHTYDSLATWNKSVTNANACQGLAGATANLCSTTPSTLQMSTDPSSVFPLRANATGTAAVRDHQLPDADRKWTMYGGALVRDAVLGHSMTNAATVGGDDLVKVSVTFKNPNPSKATDAILLFGGHLAVGADAPNVPRNWGARAGASSVSGGSYAFKLESLDGVTVGATANNIQAGAAAPLPPPAFSITKTATPSPVAAGGTVTYKVTVKNTGGMPGSTTFIDDHADAITPSAVTTDPAGGTCSATTAAGTTNKVLSCTTASIAVGASQTFTYTAAMPTTFTAGAATGGCGAGTYPVVNTATLATLYAVAPTSATATVCVAAAPALTVTKRAGTTTALPGDTVTYTVTVTNSGSAPGSTTIADDYDDRITAISSIRLSGVSGITCTLTTLSGNKVLSCPSFSVPAKSSVTLTYTATMPATFADGASTTGCTTGYAVFNTVTVTGGATDKATICVDATPAFTVTKTADTKTAAPGQIVTYTVSVKNTGKAAGTATFTDNFDDRLTPTAIAGATCAVVDVSTTATPDRALRCTTGSIPANGTVGVTYKMTMPSTFTGTPGSGCTVGYPVYNSVRIGDATDQYTVCVDAKPLFSVTKAASAKDVDPGASVTYTVVVRNSGSAPGSTTAVDDYAPGVVITRVPADCTDDGDRLTCTTGTIEAGRDRTFTYTATMPSTFTGSPGGGTCSSTRFRVTNTVTLTAASVTPVTVDVCVLATPKFSVKKTFAPATVAAGGTVTYTVTVTNTGSAPGSTTMVDTFDPRITPSSATSVPTAATCAPNTMTRQFTCATLTLNPGGTQTFTYTATMPATFSAADVDTDTVNPCAPGSYPVRNTATVTGDISSTKVCVTASPAFTILKQAGSERAIPGGPVTYTVTVTNTGDAQGSTTFTDVTEAIVDRAPAGCTLTARTDSGGKVVGSRLDCTVTGLKARTSTTITYTAAMPARFTGSPSSTVCSPAGYPVVNTATLAGGPSSKATVCVDATARFTVSKGVDVVKPKAGATVTYTVTVTNTGTAPGSTTFVDDYDDRLTLVQVPQGCADSGTKLTCTTDVLEVDGTQAFVYKAKLPATFSGPSGVAPCGTGEFTVKNAVTIGGILVADQTVCVTAEAILTVGKTVSGGPYSPGDTIRYTLTIKNTGTAPGSTTATDTLDPRLTGVSTPDGCTLAGTTLTCPTGTIPAGEQKVFSYTAVLPTTFTGDSGQNGCGPDTFPVVNGVTLTSGGTASATVCVPATPTLTLEKTSSIDVRSDGRQVITYVIRYRNTGAAQARDVVLRDAIPSGTTFSSCSGTCSVVGSPATASWTLAPIAAAGGSGSVTLTVVVTSDKTCSISNTASIRSGGRPEVLSNTVTDTVTPLPDPTTARANGTGTGIRITANGVLNIVTGLVDAVLGTNQTTFGIASTSQVGTGGPTNADKTVLKADVLGLVDAGVIRTTSSSTVTPAPSEARQTSTSEIARVCLVPVAGLCTVETGTVRSVASTVAAGDRASVSSAGSTIENLKIVGLATPVDLNQTTKVELNPLVFGPGSYVAINERSSSTGVSNGRWSADLTVAMIHVKITGILLGVQAVDIVVGEATAHSDFAQTFLCSAAPVRTVGASAYAARLGVKPIVDLTQGYAQIAPQGGDESEHVADLALPADGSVLGATVADSRTTGAITSTAATSRAWSQVGGDGAGRLCVLRSVTGCVVGATLVRSETSTTATSAGSTSSSAGTSFVDLTVLGLPIAANPRPNTTIALPGIGFVVLNEQVCDNGALPTASDTCTGAPGSGMTVRGLRVVVTVADAVLGASPGVELVVAEARSAATFN